MTKKKQFDDEAILAKIAYYIVANPKLTFEQAMKIAIRNHPELVDHDGHSTH